MVSRRCPTESAARRTLGALIAFECCLVAVYLTCIVFGEPSWPVRRLFDLDFERTVPALFSSIQLFAVGIVFASMAWPPERLRTGTGRLFALLGAAFVFLAFDEAFSIHERISRNFRHLEWLPSFRGNRGLWVVPYLLFGLAFFALMAREFLLMWKNNRRETTILAIGFSIFLLGVVGLEVLSYQFLRGLVAPKVYQLEVAAEEFLEMLGISVVLYGAFILRSRRPQAGASELRKT